MSQLETWRLLPYDIGPSERHVRMSDALVRHAQTPTVWWHSADSPTLILGAGQSTPPPIASEAEGRTTRSVRRHAGGTAVYATEGTLGLDVALPKGHRLAGQDIVEAYRWLGEVWMAALLSLGIEGHLVTIAEARAATADLSPKYAPLLRAACFGTLSPYEVAVGGRKLVGLAQVRRQTGILLQAGVHRHFDARSLVVQLEGTSDDAAIEALRSAAVGLDELTAHPPSPSQLFDAIAEALMRLQRVQLETGAWTDGEIQHLNAGT